MRRTRTWTAPSGPPRPAGTRTRTPSPGLSPAWSGSAAASSIRRCRCCRRAWTPAARRTWTSGGRSPPPCWGLRASCLAVPRGGWGRLRAAARHRDKTQEHVAVGLGLLREMDIRFWSARAAEELMGLGHLFIVARHNVQLYDYLKQEFAGEPVTVMLDRREGERRQRGDEPAGKERRKGDRRRRKDTDQAPQ